MGVYIVNTFKGFIKKQLLDAFKAGKAAGEAAINEKYKAIRDAGMKDAWNTARALMLNEEDGGISTSECYSIFGSTNADVVLREMEPDAVKQKIYEYYNSRRCENCLHCVPYHTTDRDVNEMCCIVHVRRGGSSVFMVRKNDKCSRFTERPEKEPGYAVLDAEGKSEE